MSSVRIKVLYGLRTRLTCAMMYHDGSMVYHNGTVLICGSQEFIII